MTLFQSLETKSLSRLLQEIQIVVHVAFVTVCLNRHRMRINSRPLGQPLKRTKPMLDDAPIHLIFMVDFDQPSPTLLTFQCFQFSQLTNQLRNCRFGKITPSVYVLALQADGFYRRLRDCYILFYFPGTHNYQCIKVVFSEISTSLHTTLNASRISLSKTP